MKKVLVMFGGISPENEVSVITGLQVVENIDREKYEVSVIEISKNGEIYWLKDVAHRKDYRDAKRVLASFGRDEKGGFVKANLKKIYPEVAYLAFHGGGGEGGYVQGMMQTLGIGVTSPMTEGAILSMNKVLNKQLAQGVGIPVLKGIGLMARDIKDDSKGVARDVIESLPLPVIVKPAHLGSSIGISIAKEEIELEKALIVAARVDDEILVEEFLADYDEFNCSAIRIDEEVVLSAIERPLREDEILSFADKYQKGGGKKSKSGGSGMASLVRELPAKIDQKLEEKIRIYAQDIYNELRCDGLVRIDFMYSGGKLYFTELNQIPGSMSYYLWEAAGVSFKEQITRSLEEAIKTHTAHAVKDMEYSTDIIETFVNQ